MEVIVKPVANKKRKVALKVMLKSNPKVIFVGHTQGRAHVTDIKLPRSSAGMRITWCRLGSAA